MKYSLVLIALAASAFAAPALTPRDPQRGGNRGNQDHANQANQAVPNAAATQVPTTQVATDPATSQPAASPTAAATPAASASVSAGGTITDAQVPDFGVTAGVPDPKQAGSCLGLGGATIPCFCPPPRDEFIARLNEIVAAGNAFGHPAEFPTDDSTASAAARKSALIVTMQNFNGTASGVGCPSKAANF